VPASFCAMLFVFRLLSLPYYFSFLASLHSNSVVARSRHPVGSIHHFENTDPRASLGSSKSLPIASFQHGVLESSLTWMSPKASLQSWMPAIHGGMTKISTFILYGRA